MSPTKSTLRYSQIRCLRCGEIRVRGVACDACGLRPDPREIDPDRPRIELLCRRAIDALHSSPKPSAKPLEATEVWGRLEPLGSQALEALADAVQHPVDEQSLIEATTAISQARVDIAHAPRLRPWGKTWEAASETIEGLSDAVEMFIQAHAQKQPIDAQRLARAAQARLDVAGDLVAPTVAPLLRAERIATAASYEEAMVEASSQLFARTSATDLLSLDRELSSLLERVAKGRGPWPNGAGLTVGLLYEDVAGTCDDDRFWAVASLTFASLTASSGWVPLMKSTAWLDDFDHLLLRAHDASVGVRGMLASARHARHEVDALLTGTHALIEGVAKYLLALLLASGGRGRYIDLRMLDASVLIRQATAGGLVDLLEGLEHTLRVSEAHDEFKVIGDQIRFTARTAEYPQLSVGELVDKALAAQESTHGITVGVYAAALIAEAPPTNLGPQDFGVDPITMARSFMELGGYPIASAEVEGGRLLLTTTRQVSARTLPQVAAVLQFLPEEWDSLSVGDMDGTEIVGPLEPLREAARTTDEFAKMLHFWEGYRSWSCAGSEIVSVEHLRKLVAVAAIKVLMSESHPRDKVSRLRQLRDLAVSDVALADAVSAGIALVREQALGNPTPETIRRVDLISEFANKRLTSPF